MKKQLRGGLCLTLCTVVWGSAFVAQSVGMDHIGPFAFQAIRCLLAVLGLLPIIVLTDHGNHRSFWNAWKDKTLWKAGLLCGIFLFLACNLQQIGLVDTDAGKSAFLTAMYIVFVPILGIFTRRKPSKMIPFSVVLAALGLYFLSCAGGSGIAAGDLLLLGCALAFAVQILFVDRYSPKVDPLRLSLLQALVCSVLSAVVMFFTETTALQGIWDCAIPLAYAGFLSMGAAYSLQIIGQRDLEPSAASLIMSLESVFAVLFGCLLLNETLSPWESIGCVLVFSAVILSQLPEPRKKTK